MWISTESLIFQTFGNLERSIWYYPISTFLLVYVKDKRLLNGFQSKSRKQNFLRKDVEVESYNISLILMRLEMTMVSSFYEPVLGAIHKQRQHIFDPPPPHQFVDTFNKSGPFPSKSPRAGGLVDCQNSGKFLKNFFENQRQKVHFWNLSDFFSDFYKKIK